MRKTDINEITQYQEEIPMDLAEKLILNRTLSKEEYIELFQEGKKIWKREKYW